MATTTRLQLADENSSARAAAHDTGHAAVALRWVVTRKSSAEKCMGGLRQKKEKKENAVAHDSSLGFANFLFNEMYNSWILIFHTLTSVDSARLMAFKTYELPLS